MERMQGIRAVLFDLDDTLYDRLPAVRRYASTYFLRDFGPRLEDVGSERLSGMVVRADGGPSRSGPEAMRAIRRELPWKNSHNSPSPQELLAHWREYFPYCARGTPEMRNTLATLKSGGFLLGIVTNGVGLGQNRKIDVLGIRAYLDCVVISGEFGVRKPDPRIFHEALRRLSVSARYGLFVGDNPVVDIAGAQSAGMEAVWFRTNHRQWCGPPAQPPHAISDLMALPALLAMP